MSKKILKNKVKKKDKRLLVAINEEEDFLIQSKADQFANGNVSSWVRHAAINHIPKNSELEEKN